MRRKKVSVIVPVYNVESYLEECINSLMSQDYYNLEIILIDDASTDNSPFLCDKAAMIDERIKVIHKQNGGAASARNVGLNVMSGDYVCFVDSDDYVEKDYVQKLVENLEKANADVAVCGFWYLYKNYEEKNGQLNKTKVMSQIDFLKNFLTDWTSGLIWNKIFCSDVVRDIRFEEGHKIDDEFFTYKVIMKCQKIVMFETPLYYYRMRASSVMSSSFKYQKQIILDRVEYITERFDLVTKEYPELRLVYIEDLTDNLIRLWRMSGEFSDIRSKLKRIIKKYIKLILTAKISTKLKYAFVCTILFERKQAHYKEVKKKNVKKLFE